MQTTELTSVSSNNRNLFRLFDLVATLNIHTEETQIETMPAR